jgi:hypothetical protein
VTPRARGPVRPADELEPELEAQVHDLVLDPDQTACAARIDGLGAAGEDKADHPPIPC